MIFMLDKIYNGQEIDAFVINESSETKTVIVYFDHLGDRKSNLEYISNSDDRALGPAKAFGRTGYKIYIIIAKRGHWYQSNETEIFIRNIVNKNPELKFIHIGYSMGGFAAINFAYLNSARVLAFQPQAVLGENVPMTQAYIECFNKLLKGQFKSNIVNKICSDVEGFVFYDNKNSIDSWHANIICLHTKMNCIVIPYAGHATSNVINRNYKLYDLLKDFAENIFNESIFYQKFDISKTDEFISNQIQENIKILQDIDTCKSTLSKLNISYNSGFFSYGLSQILKLKIDETILNYEIIKLIIKILLKNRNFYDLLSILKKVNSIDSKASDAIKNLVYLGLGIAYHCIGNENEGNINLIKSICFENKDYFSLWHLNKFLPKEQNVIKYIKANGTKKQLEALNII